MRSRTSIIDKNANLSYSRDGFAEKTGSPSTKRTKRDSIENIIEMREFQNES